MLVKIKILKAVDMLNYDESEEYIMNTADSIRLLDGTMVLVADLQTDTALNIYYDERYETNVYRKVSSVMPVRELRLADFAHGLCNKIN